MVVAAVNFSMRGRLFTCHCYSLPFTALLEGSRATKRCVLTMFPHFLFLKKERKPKKRKRRPRRRPSNNSNRNRSDSSNRSNRRSKKEGPAEKKKKKKRSERIEGVGH